MKSMLAVLIVVGFVAAEVPSHSYLPPPPRGYPKASSPPSIIAARTLEGQNPDHHNGDHLSVAVARSSPQPLEQTTPIPLARFGTDEQGYEQNAVGYRNGLEDINTTVSYEGDEKSFKPQTYEDSEEYVRSTGYDNNSNNYRSNNGNQGNDQYGVHNNNGYQGNGNDGGRYHSNEDARARRSHGLH